MLTSQIKAKSTARVMPRDLARWRVQDFGEIMQKSFGGLLCIRRLGKPKQTEKSMESSLLDC